MSEADQPKPDAPPAAPPGDLWAQLMRQNEFHILLVLLMGLATFVTFPLRNHVLVLWVYGEAGAQQGIHVLPGKPVKFSDGHEVPTLLDMATGFGAFVLAVVGTLTVTFLVVKFYEGLRKEMRQE